MKKNQYIGDKNTTIPYTPDEKTRLIKLLSGVLTGKSQGVVRAEEPRYLLGVMDAANVCAIIAKTPRAEEVLKGFVDENEPLGKLPLLFYTKENLGSSKACSWYLKKTLAILTATSEAVRISAGRDYPFLMATPDFSIILAPRVTNDEVEE